MNEFRCAFLTLKDPTGFFIYDELTFAPLAAHGWKVENIPWNQRGVDWNGFDLVVIRSPWDYQCDVQGFLRVLEEINDSKAQLENPLSMVRWNLNKGYLRELENKGITIVPTRWPNGLRYEDIGRYCNEFEAEEIVVKPLIGANADDTFRLGRNMDQRQADEAVACFSQRELMVQPFVPEVVEVGEFSLFFFGGEYSHCVLKTPKKGDYRVQEEHGGGIRSVLPDSDLRSAGVKVIDAIAEIGGSLLYARVDLVRLPDSGEPALMEVELIEPSLYFSYDEQSPQRFADAVQRLFAN